MNSPIGILYNKRKSTQKQSQNYNLQHKLNSHLQSPTAHRPTAPQAQQSQRTEGAPNLMTTMQEALADKFLSAAEIPDFLQQTADLMQRTFKNEKYGNEGLRLSDSNNMTGSFGIPSKKQNRIRSGRAGRRAARNRQDLARVGGLSYKGPWDAIKASTKPADYEMCRTERKG